MNKEAMKLALITEAAIQSKDHPSKDARMFAKAVHDYFMAEQPAQQEPVAWITKTGNVWKTKAHSTDIPLYTAPPAQRKPLTNEQIAEACGWKAEMGCKPLPRELRIARAIEAAHGITGETQ